MIRQAKVAEEEMERAWKVEKELAKRQAEAEMAMRLLLEEEEEERKAVAAREAKKLKGSGK